MKTVWKFEVPISEGLRLKLGASARVLHFDNQREVPTLWVLVDSGELHTVERSFRLYGTGHAIAEDAARHVGTAQFADGSLVLHLFEVPA